MPIASSALPDFLAAAWGDQSKPTPQMAVGSPKAEEVFVCEACDETNFRECKACCGAGFVRFARKPDPAPAPPKEGPECVHKWTNLEAINLHFCVNCGEVHPDAAMAALPYRGFDGY